MCLRASPLFIDIIKIRRAPGGWALPVWFCEQRWGSAREPVSCSHSPCPWQDTVFRVPMATWMYQWRHLLSHSSSYTHCPSKHCLSTYFSQVLGMNNWMWALLWGSVWRKGTWKPRHFTTACLPYHRCAESAVGQGENHKEVKFKLSSEEFTKQPEEKALSQYCNYFTLLSPHLRKG